MTTQETIKRILVVDDDVELAKTIETHLKWEDFNVITACDGLEARDTITALFEKGEPVEVVITDIMMPRSDGFELIEWIKKTHKDISIIVISGYVDPQTIKEALRPEKDCYKLKPLSPTDMLRLINRIETKREVCRDMKNKEYCDYCKELL